MRRAIKFIVLLVFMLSLWQYKMISYGIDQGIGQLKIIVGAIPINELSENTSFPDSLRSKLSLIQEVREFAIDSLGLEDSDSYKSVYDQKGKPVLWVVSASPPFKMEEYKWSYPFLGDLGYKGFFKEESAIDESNKLLDLGLDVDVSPVNAWSTLGYFDDPILSSMLSKLEGELARLIIHELTHATIYIKSDADYNENLATFIGDNGAKEFLKYKYGLSSKEYSDYVHRLDDINMFTKHMLRGAKQLDSLYSLIGNYPLEVKLKLKEGFISTIVSYVDTLSLHNKLQFEFLKQPDFHPNNTYFMTYVMYREQQQEFDVEFKSKFNSDYRLYINYLIDKFE